MKPKAPGPSARDDVELLDKYAVRTGSGVWLSSWQSCLDVQRSLEESVKAYSVNGQATPSRVLALILALEQERAAFQAAASARGSAEVPHEPDLPVSTHADEVGTKTAAQMLGITDRQVRNRAEELGGRRAGRQWLFDRRLIEVEADRRKREGKTS